MIFSDRSDMHEVARQGCRGAVRSNTHSVPPGASNGFCTFQGCERRKIDADSIVALSNRREVVGLDHHRGEPRTGLPADGGACTCLSSELPQAFAPSR